MSIAGCMKIFLLTDKHLTGNQMFSFKFVDLQILFENVKCQNMMTLLCYSFLFNAYFSQSCFTLQLVVSIHTWKYRLAYFFKRIAILRFSCVEGLHFLLFCLPSISLFLRGFLWKSCEMCSWFHETCIVLCQIPDYCIRSQIHVLLWPNSIWTRQVDHRGGTLGCSAY